MKMTKMYRNIVSTVSSAVLATALFSVPVRAQQPADDRDSPSSMQLIPEVPAEIIAYDVLVARPAGAVATVVGAAIFVVSLPFGLLSGSTEKAAQKLVKDPAHYTFTRPLGRDIKPSTVD